MNVFESRIIGGILAGIITPGEIDLAGSDFSDADLGACLTHARHLESEGVEIDAEILHSRLAAKDQCFYSVGDFKRMAVATSSSSIVWDAIDQIKAASLKALILSETATISLENDKDAGYLLDRLKAVVDMADERYRTSANNFVFLSEIVPKMKALFEDLHAGVSYAVPTFYPDVDNLLIDGFSRGDEHIIAGFTGSGKSALALAFARRQARNGMCVGVVSREMSALENGMRLAAADSGIPRWMMKKGMFKNTRDDLNAYIEEKLAVLPIAFDTHTTDVESLKGQTKRMVEQHDMKILYVDYLQLLSTSSKLSTRANEVQFISRTLKEIAMENKIPVVSLCQFNRGATQASIYDILSHLKESSGIEQDASTILYIQIEKTDQQKQVKDARLTVLKNRNGATFKTVDLAYRGEIFTFEELGQTTLDS